MDSTVDRIRAIIAWIFVKKIEEILPKSNVIDDLGGDSLEIMEIVIAAEREFGIRIPDQALKLVGETAESLAAVVDRILNPPKPEDPEAEKAEETSE